MTRKWKMLPVTVLLLALAGCQTVPEGSVPEEYWWTFGFEMSESEIFALSMRWLAKSFVSAESVIEYSDKEVGIIVGNGLVPDFTFSFTIEVKEGKARLTWSEFGRDYSSTTSPLARIIMASQGFGPDEYELLLPIMRAMAKDYQKYVSSTSTDW